MNFKQIRILLWVVVVLIAAIVLAAKLRIDDDLTVFLPTEGSPVEDLLFARLREGPAARLILAAFRGGELADRVAASKEAAAALEQRGDLGRITNGEQPMSPETFAGLFAYRYLLADAGPLDRAALEPAIAERARQIASPFGKMYAREAAIDPTGLFRQVLVSWRDGAKPPRREDGVWVTEDGSRSLLLVETGQRGYDVGRQRALVAGLQAELLEIAAGHGVEVDLAGSPVTTLRSSAQVSKEMTIFSLAATSMVVAFLLWVYRSPRVLLLGALPIATGVLIGVAAVLLWSGAVHRITLSFGVTLLGIAIDYPLHLFSHAGPGQPLETAARRIAAPMLMGAITTVAAFLILGSGGIEGLTQLALFTAFGLIGAVLTARYVLPAIAGDALLFEDARAPLALDRMPPRWAGSAFLALSGVALLSIFAMADDPWERDLSALSPVPQAVKSLDGELRAELGAPDLRYMFLAEGGDAEAMLQALEGLEPVLADLRDRGAIQGSDGIHRYLPSMKSQALRQAALPEPEQLEAAIDAARAPAELAPDMFQPFIQAVADSRTLELLPAERGLEMFRGTPLWPKLANLMVTRDGRTYGFVPLSGVQDLEALRQAAAGVPGVSYVDLKQISSASVTSFRDQALVRLCLGVGVILVLLLIVRREIKIVLLILAALASALVITAAILMLLGEKFSLFHILASLVVIGVGLDYGLFFSWKGEKPEERRRAFHGVLICAVSTVIVFALLAFSSVAVLQVIGLTVALGTCVAFVSCYLLVALPSWRAQAAA